VILLRIRRLGLASELLGGLVLMAVGIAIASGIL
jgi:hypothetical protein